LGPNPSSDQAIKELTMIVWMAREQRQLKSFGSEGLGNPMGNARSIANDEASW
jgi:hypothetical protein